MDIHSLFNHSQIFLVSLSDYFNSSDFLKRDDFRLLLIRGVWNFLMTYILVRHIYFPLTKNKEYFFVYFVFSVIIFFLSYLMNSVKLSAGFGFGLFAVFAILRYRTDQIPIKEMTYLFIVITIAVINAVTIKKVSDLEVAFANVSIVALTYVMEKLWLVSYESSKLVDYERIELIKPENHGELLEDLQSRTGLPVYRFEILRIDFLRDTARLRVYYKENREQHYNV